MFRFQRVELAFTIGRKTSCITPVFRSMPRLELPGLPQSVCQEFGEEALSLRFYGPWSKNM